MAKDVFLKFANLVGEGGGGWNGEEKNPLTKFLYLCYYSPTFKG